MKNLIIHPKDPSTSFLLQIYAPLKNKTVISGGITQNELRKLIKSHDRIIMMGHGVVFHFVKINIIAETELEFTTKLATARNRCCVFVSLIQLKNLE